MQLVKLQAGIRRIMPLSNCCGAGFDEDYGVCPECLEHCGADEMPTIPGFEDSMEKFDTMMATAKRIIKKGKEIEKK